MIIIEKKSKVKIIGNTPADDSTKNVKIIVPLNYLHIFGELLKFHWLIAKLILFWHGHQLALLLFLQVQEDLQ